MGYALQVLPILQFYIYFHRVRLGDPSSSEQRMKVLEQVSVEVLKVASLAECE